MEAFYFALGDVDAYIILDLPDNVSAAAVSLAAHQGGLTLLVPVCAPMRREHSSHVGHNLDR